MAGIKRITHIGVVVKDIDSALLFWRNILGLSAASVEDVPAEQTRIVRLPVGGAEVELVEPTAADSGTARFLRKRGPGLHHLCLEVDNLEGLMAWLRGQGIRLINDAPRVDAGGMRYAFVHPRSTGGVLIELHELPR
jgi:methylmalonyl-CoA/ethylmalonyl-CoA epimerase